MKDIERTVEEFRGVVVRADATVPAVSSWSVGEHVHHCCLSMIGISKSLRKSTPPAPRAKPTIARAAVLGLGFIPRGRAKSPSFVVPKPAIPQEELRAMLDQSAELLAMAHGLDRGTWFTHPFLGTMHRDQALKFVLVHNRHHLKIVADILKQQR
ncbi:MAG TPA: DinB family protein [Candidatus Krumholzibacteria bacterium]|nr:DinB family protein [Candidatus Krumholzibacteria bacterium]